MSSEDLAVAAEPVGDLRKRLLQVADHLEKQVADDHALTVEDGQFAAGMSYAAELIREALNDS